MKKRVFTDQELFFNQNALKEEAISQPEIIYQYVKKEQIKGFEWISECKNILEYGCGTGTSLDVFFKNRNIGEYNIWGVDIAEKAIEKAKEKYPSLKFIRISNNKIFDIKDNFLDAVFMFHVLHHTDNHSEIFKEISRKLKPGGKFLINDMSSNNPFIRFGRFIFSYTPKFVKNKFSGDDLVVDGEIPEKNRVDINATVESLKSYGFSIEEVGTGHLFFFLFAWVDRFLPFNRFRIVRFIYKKLIALEALLLKDKYFQKFGEVFYIKCRKIS